MSWDNPETLFDVVINQEEQYSIWPDYKALPAGWTKVGFQSTKEHCLAHIETVWTDMRPLSLRLALAKQI